jgi:ABC-type transport system involved in multi-copper enzyme maturation permease subunit
MKSIIAALWAEVLKIRKSKLLWISIMAAFFFAFVMGFLMFVLKNPEIARKYALIAAKASIAGEADWPSFFMMLTMGMAGAGFMGFGFLASWIFGREYSDRTFKDMLALPASRSSIILSKFVALVIWCCLLSLLMFALGLLAGSIVGLDGWSNETVSNGAVTFIVTSILTILLVTPVAFFACFGRGFLPPLGFMVLTLILAQIAGLLGYGQYFPWAIPLITSGAAGSEIQPLGVESYIILFLTSIAGLLGTFAWWRFADQA